MDRGWGKSSGFDVREKRIERVVVRVVIRGTPLRMTESSDMVDSFGLMINDQRASENMYVSYLRMRKVSRQPAIS